MKKIIGDRSYSRNRLEIEAMRKKSTMIIAVFSTPLFIAIYLFLSGNLVLGGVPSSIIMKFLQDSVAVDAYFSRDGRLVHDRLQKLNVEKEIKDHYRDQISDPIELDRYVHQILYERTGYIGVDYQLSASGNLKLKDGTKTPNTTYR